MLYCFGAGGQNRTADLSVMNATLLPTELPRLNYIKLYITTSGIFPRRARVPDSPKPFVT